MRPGTWLFPPLLFHPPHLPPLHFFSHMLFCSSPLPLSCSITQLLSPSSTPETLNHQHHPHTAQTGRNAKMSIKITVSEWKLLSKCISLRKIRGMRWKCCKHEPLQFICVYFSTKSSSNNVNGETKRSKSERESDTRWEISEERDWSCYWQRLWWEWQQYLRMIDKEDFDIHWQIE